MEITKELIINELIEYAANNKTPILDSTIDATYREQIDAELRDFSDEIENAPCDDDGPSAEQSATIDEIVSRYAQAIINIIESN